MVSIQVPLLTNHQEELCHKNVRERFGGMFKAVPGLRLTHGLLVNVTIRVGTTSLDVRQTLPTHPPCVVDCQCFHRLHGSYLKWLLDSTYEWWVIFCWAHSADSSQHVCIEDCYISVGDDAISIKSGWDQYGISYGMPSKHIQIRRIVSASKTFGIHAGVSFGSEMSGGISNIKVGVYRHWFQKYFIYRTRDWTASTYPFYLQVDDMVLYGARWGVRFKTSPGRGGYIKHVAVHNLLLHSVKTAVAFMANYGQHPDDNWNRTAYPVIENIVIKNIVGENITQAGILQGLPESPFRHIHLKTIALDVRSTKNVWNCSWVSGSYFFVVPQPCADLTRQNITL